MEVFVRPDGSTQAIYSDALKLEQLGAPDIKRASHVEPDPKQPGKWFVDMTPVGGPTRDGFATRQEAIDFELEWLAARLASGPVEVRAP